MCKDEPSLLWAADLNRALQVSLIGYAVGGAFLGLAYFDYYYHLLAIIVLMRTLVTKRLNELVAVPAGGTRANDPEDHAVRAPSGFAAARLQRETKAKARAGDRFASGSRH
jgi:hypothetical protein